MEDCEICGRQISTVYVVKIENAIMNLCARCAKGKTPIEVIEEQVKSRPSHMQEKKSAEEYEVVSDYGKRIRNAMSSMGLTTKVLAERINEKESVLIRVENQKLPPDDKLVKKLERELNVRLTQEIKEERSRAPPRHNEPLTLGDMAIRKEKK